MFNRRTLTIIKRELREKVLSKSFIFMTSPDTGFYFYNTWPADGII